MAWFRMSVLNIITCLEGWIVWKVSIFLVNLKTWWSAIYFVMLLALYSVGYVIFLHEWQWSKMNQFSKYLHGPSCASPLEFSFLEQENEEVSVASKHSVLSERCSPECDCTICGVAGGPAFASCGSAFQSEKHPSVLLLSWYLWEKLLAKHLLITYCRLSPGPGPLSLGHTDIKSAFQEVTV
jgi:hypothetical protein